MIIKRSGSKIFGMHMSKAEKQALDIEIRKSIAENEMRYRKLHDQLAEHYLVEDYEAAWVCKEKLKNIGFDIDEWERESNART